MCVVSSGLWFFTMWRILAAWEKQSGLSLCRAALLFLVPAMYVAKGLLLGDWVIGQGLYFSMELWTPDLWGSKGTWPCHYSSPLFNTWGANSYCRWHSLFCCCLFDLVYFKISLGMNSRMTLLFILWTFEKDCVICLRGRNLKLSISWMIINTF